MRGRVALALATAQPAAADGAGEKVDGKEAPEEIGPEGVALPWYGIHDGSRFR